MLLELVAERKIKSHSTDPVLVGMNCKVVLSEEMRLISSLTAYLIDSAWKAGRYLAG